MTTPTTTTPGPVSDADLGLAGLNTEGNPLDEDQQEGENEGAGRGGRNAEAARRRVELREAQAERDSLREQVVGLQRAEVERLAGESLAQAADLFDIGGVSIDDVLDDEGRVDPEAVTVAVATLLDARPGLRLTPRRPGGGVPSHGLGYRAPTPAGGPSWSDVIQGN